MVYQRPPQVQADDDQPMSNHPQHPPGLFPVPQSMASAVLPFTEECERDPITGQVRSCFMYSVCVCVCVRACVRACVRVCVCVIEEQALNVSRSSCTPTPDVRYKQTLSTIKYSAKQESYFAKAIYVH